MKYSYEFVEWSPRTLCAVGAAIIGGTSLLSAGVNLYGASQQADVAREAGQAQAQVAGQAADNQLQMFHETQANLKPFINAGYNALDALQTGTGTNAGGNPLTAPLTAPFNPTQAQLESTPGYKFTKDQGLQAVTNQFASMGLGDSGALLKGATNYAEGLAGTTFQTQFGNYLAQNQQIYNMLAGQVATGQNAATNVGSLGLQSQTQANALQTGGAAAAAAGQVGGANALTAGLSNVGNTATNAAFLYGLNNGGLFNKADK